MLKMLNCKYTIVICMLAIYTIVQSRPSRHSSDAQSYAATPAMMYMSKHANPVIRPVILRPIESFFWDSMVVVSPLCSAFWAFGRNNMSMYICHTVTNCFALQVYYQVAPTEMPCADFDLVMLLSERVWTIDKSSRASYTIVIEYFPSKI